MLLRLPGSTLLAMRTRSAGNAGAYALVIAAATRKANALKIKMNREIQMLGLEGTVGIHRRWRSPILGLFRVQIPFLAIAAYAHCAD
jgi:hypothetical protein